MKVVLFIRINISGDLLSMLWYRYNDLRDVVDTILYVLYVDVEFIVFEL